MVTGCAFGTDIYQWMFYKKKVNMVQGQQDDTLYCVEMATICAWSSLSEMYTIPKARHSSEKPMMYVMFSMKFEGFIYISCVSFILKVLTNPPITALFSINVWHTTYQWSIRNDHKVVKAKAWPLYGEMPRFYCLRFNPNCMILQTSFIIIC